MKSIISISLSLPESPELSCATPASQVHSIVCMSQTIPVEMAKAVEVRGGREQDHTALRVAASSTRWTCYIWTGSIPGAGSHGRCKDKSRKEPKCKLIDREVRLDNMVLVTPGPRGQPI